MLRGFFEEECAKYRQVIYVMGNHEHYHFCYDDTYQHIKNRLPDNVYLLENETKEIDGVVFIGATLWTDCNRNDPITMMTLRQSMNEYRVVKKKPSIEHNFWGRLTPETTYYAHQKSKAYIAGQLQTHAGRKCVIVTHHAPSELSVSPEYKLEQHMNGGYFSNMDNFIMANPNIAVWTHGHTHNTFDYMIGSTRVLCNPRGYKYYESRADEFDPEIGFEIE